MPDPLRGVCRRLRERGKRSWIVGGCVRDLLRGREPEDWDLATDARPEEVMEIFPRSIPTGIQHGTVTVLAGREKYEVTTLRGDGAYTDGRRPDAVAFTDDVSLDLARRDFTVNAIALDPLDGHVIDPWGGQGDLARRVIRAVGRAEERFAEDGLRILRAARFVATLHYELDPDTERAMGAEISLATYRKVSAERIREEWLKAMKADRPSRAFEVMLRTRILEATCPELLPLVGCEQNRFHAFDVWGHTLAVVDAAPRTEPILRVAALFHDVAKPATRARSDKTQDWTFYEHERIGAEMVLPILERLRFSNEERRVVSSLVRHHLVCYADDWTDAAVRRWLVRVTPELAPLLYELAVADARGKGKETEDEGLIRRLEARARAVLEAKQALGPKDLAIDGRDLMKELGLAPGRLIGELLAALVEVVVEDPEKNQREQLLEAARRAVAARAGSAGSSGG